ncbi:MAG TPA: phosphatase PAP2 family protein [Methylomirabilota bacterium]|nr:phosphatase PAP2 family protein [Methylomirabilota bacterium]
MLALAVASALAFLVLAVLAFNQHFFDVDHSAHDLVRAGLYPELRPLMQALSRIGSGYVLVPLALVGYLALRRQGHRLARLIPAMVAGAFVFFALAKWIVARPRPKLSPYGFPSAHTFGAVVFFGAVIYALWTIEMRPIWRWTGTVAMLLLIAGVAVSRLYLRSHWLSDVLGGLTGGGAYLLFFLLTADPRLRPQR